MKIVLLFSGQGAQYPGMLKDVIETYSEARRLFDEASSILERDIYHLTMDAAQEELNETLNTQPAMLVCELALLRVLKNSGLSYDAAAGFSLGEWAAVVAAGCISESDAIRMIGKRAQAMQDAVPVGRGAMAFMLGQSDEFVEEFCRSIGDVAPANYNGYGNVSVAGTAEAIQCFLKKAEKEKLVAGLIPVSIPSHSPLMQSAAEQLFPLIQAMGIQTPETELFMNATGAIAEEPEQIKKNLIQQLVQPVKFRHITQQLLEEGYDTFIEVGPGETLTKMVKRTAKRNKKPVTALAVCNMSAIQKLQDLIQTERT